MKWPALLLPALLLSGCLMPPADCRPYASVSWNDLGTYDALADAGAGRSKAHAGLPYHNAALDPLWHDYRLRAVGWSDPLAPTEGRERSPDGGGIDQETDSSRVRFSMGIDARKGEAEVRALFDLIARNVTAASPAELDRLYASLLESREESHILYPDDPALRQVMNHGYSVRMRLPLRLDALDAQLRAVHAPEHEQIQLGEATRRLGPWTFRFDLPVRSAEVGVGDADVTVTADAGGRGQAVARGVGNATAGHGAILSAFGELGIRPPEFSGPPGYFVPEGSGAGSTAHEFPCGT